MPAGPARAAAAIDHALVIEHAMRRRVLLPLLDSMGFERLLGPLPRGGVPAFDDGYRRIPAGLRARLARAYGDRQAARALRARRADAAAANRGLAGHRMLLLARDAAPRIAVWLDIDSGEWRDSTGGAAGADIVRLGALMWGCRPGQAAWRCARVAGLRHLPRLRPDAWSLTAASGSGHTPGVLSGRVISGFR
ncbi:MAG TPA: hypothetical protein VGM87_25580 [Roseomonas sp.]|jgi:hypothetical protein